MSVPLSTETVTVEGMTAGRRVVVRWLATVLDAEDLLALEELWRFVTMITPATTAPTTSRAASTIRTRSGPSPPRSRAHRHHPGRGPPGRRP